FRRLRRRLRRHVRRLRARPVRRASIRRPARQFRLQPAHTRSVGIRVNLNNGRSLRRARVCVERDAAAGSFILELVPMTNFFRRWLRSARRPTKPIRNSSFNLERLDDRLVPSVGSSGYGGLITGNGTEGAEVVTVRVRPSERLGPDRLVVELTHDGVSDSKSFNYPGAVPYAVLFNGLGGDDKFTNETSVR